MFSCIVSVWTSFALYISVIWIFFNGLFHTSNCVIRECFGLLRRSRRFKNLCNEYDVVICSESFIMCLIGLELFVVIISLFSICLSPCLSCTYL